MLLIYRMVMVINVYFGNDEIGDNDDDVVYDDNMM